MSNMIAAEVDPFSAASPSGEAAFDSAHRDFQVGTKSANLNSAELVALAETGRMASFIYHDLVNQLTAVRANVEFLGDDPLSSFDRASIAEDVHATIRCMKDQLDSLLLFARTGVVLNKSCCSLEQLIRRVSQLVLSHPDAARVSIVTTISEPLTCIVDESKMRSAVYNLLLNACQATGYGSVGARKVEILLQADYSGISIRFIDSGCGVSDSVRNRLFEPFVTEHKASGFGLGLTIARRVAQDHGGELFLEESRPGRTIFTFRMPFSTGPRV